MTGKRWEEGYVGAEGKRFKKPHSSPQELEAVAHSVSTVRTI